MKFEIGETAYWWNDNGESLYSGIRVEITGWEKRDGEIFYHVRPNEGFTVREDLLVNAREWQDITHRVVHGDLKGCLMDQLNKVAHNAYDEWWHKNGH